MAKAGSPPLPGGHGLYEVRFHGRGGQGTVIASIVLAEAAFLEGRGVQAFPFFGVERRGAPVVAHTRIGEGLIRLACDVDQPDAVIVMDPSLLGSVAEASLRALRPGGTALLNSSRAPPTDLGRKEPLGNVVCFDASALARKHGLGSPASPIVNTVILGAFAGLTKVVGWKALEEAIEKKVPTHTGENVAAAAEAYHAMGAT